MEIQLSDASVFRRSIDALKDFLPQAQCVVDAEGLRIRGMDVGHVGFVDYFLSAGDCEVFKPAATGATGVLGLQTTILSKVLATAAGGDRLHIQQKGAVLALRFVGDARSANFELNTLDLEEEAVDLPELSYSAVIKAKGNDFSAAVKDLNMFGDNITFCLDDDGFHMRAEGDVGKGSFTLEPSDDREMTLEGDSVSIGFSMRYVQQIIRSCCSLAGVIEVAFDPAQPLRVSAKFGSGSHFIAYLAPKVAE